MMWGFELHHFRKASVHGQDVKMSWSAGGGGSHPSAKAFAGTQCELDGVVGEESRIVKRIILKSLENKRRVGNAPFRGRGSRSQSFSRGGKPPSRRYI